MITFITIIHVVACIFLILVVLLQAGKGGGMGVAFGSATSSAVFGGRGAGSFLERLTAGTAIVFMLTSMTLAYFASRSDSVRLQKKSQEQQQKQKAAAEKDADVKAAKEAADRAKTVVPPAAPATPESSPTTATPGSTAPSTPGSSTAPPTPAPAAPNAPAPSAPAANVPVPPKAETPQPKKKVKAPKAAPAAEAPEEEKNTE